MRGFWAYVKPYTDKMKAVFWGFLVSLGLVILQDPHFLDVLGKLPGPLNTLLLMLIPVAFGWLKREKEKHPDVEFPPPDSPEVPVGP